VVIAANSSLEKGYNQQRFQVYLVENVADTGLHKITAASATEKLAQTASQLKVLHAC
jgi:hypothetical protein